MKTVHLQPFQHIMQLVVIIGIIVSIGIVNSCNQMPDDVKTPIVPDNPPTEENGDTDDNRIIADMPINKIEIKQSDTVPVQVFVNVSGYLPDSCTEYHQTTKKREANTITIHITTKRPKDAFCATIVTEYRDTIDIGTFPQGKYKVVVNGTEQEFHIE